MPERNQEDDALERIIAYSRDMTKSLFGKQVYAIPTIQDRCNTVEKSLVKPDNQLVLPKRVINTEKPKSYLVPIESHQKKLALIEPEEHRPWRLYRVISGSGGWVHCLAIEPENKWFASGSGDGLIKIWDLASGKLRFTLTGHISGVRGLVIGQRRPYLFSCADDKTIKSWDLERNSIVGHYHGHLSGVYCIGLHPEENYLFTGGRDSVSRMWDVRTKEQAGLLTGHDSVVSSILCQKSKPQIITASHDSTIRLWDMRNAQKALLTLTHHRKAVRAIAFDYPHRGFISGAIDNIKQWDLPEGNFLKNFSGHESIINALATNQNNVAVSGGNDGTLWFWDWKSGTNFQQIKCPPQPGSIEAEAGILALAFDKSGSRLVTGESDKTIKMFKEV